MKKIITIILLLLPFIFISQNQSITDSLETVIKNCKVDTLKLKLYGKLIDEYNKTNPDSALKVARKALFLAQKMKSIKMMAQAYRVLGTAFFNVEKLDSALYYAEISISMCKSNNFKEVEADNYVNLAAIYSYKHNNLMAINFCKKSLLIREELKDLKDLINGYTNLSILYIDVRDYVSALKYNYMAMKQIQRLDNKFMIWQTYNSQLEIYTYLKQFDKAIESGKIALNIARKNGDLQEILNTYRSLGNFYFDLPEQGLARLHLTSKEKLELAFQYLHEAKSIAVMNGNKFWYSRAVSDIGYAYRELGINDSAFKYYKEVLKVDTELDDNYGICVAKNALGEVAYHKGDYLLAEKLCLEALQLAETGDYIDFKSEAHEMLHLIYEKKGNPKLGLNHYKKYVEIKDKMDNDGNRIAILNEQANYEYNRKTFADSLTYATKQTVINAKLSSEKNQKLLYASIALLAILSVGFVFYQYKQKQKTNAQLQDINDKINKQNNTLKTLNKELIDSEENLQKSNSTKEQLISMMSHDLLNPITAITNYNQQIISKKTNNEDLLSAFKNVDAAIQPMHSLLDNMLQWSAIQKEGVHAKLKQQDVNDIVKEIIGIYRPQANLKFIKLNDELEKEFILETDKSILSLILRNLLNNAVKYSANTTEIKIKTNVLEKTISISDEGFGMTDEMINYLNTGQLSKIESKGTGLGLKLCFEFAAAIGASLKFRRNEKEGTMVLIHLSKI
jgi:signal transduction histidine kinase/tetratricopeptide (TPR) repeat protein